ncbi:hypothetical protein ACS2TL_27145, partial [Bacillus cereus group sp. BC326]|uniref:hypothetical protein n=1 Tax=Bacillus cereus group sp. BC326 TaxID=3445310 RepID=UPI003F1EC4A0
NIKTKKQVAPESISVVSEHQPTIDFNKGTVKFRGKMPKEEEGYVYHSTFTENVDDILKEGIIPNKKNNWQYWSEKGYSYYSKNPKDAL